MTFEEAYDIICRWEEWRSGNVDAPRLERHQEICEFLKHHARLIKVQPSNPIKSI